jgi:hypothetical protein
VGLLIGSAWTLLLIGTFLRGLKLFVDVLLRLYISSLECLELDGLQNVSASILYTTVVTLEECLIQELFERSTVSHLQEELGQLLALFVSHLLIVGLFCL